LQYESKLTFAQVYIRLAENYTIIAFDESGGIHTSPARLM